jgi:NAD(P)-dependent dehydrogenase (short-subunit alcohol dehydrogenase family)
VRLLEAISDVEVVAEVADIAEDGTAERLVALAVEKFGRVDYALNVAGVTGKLGPINEMESSNYDFVSGVNARAVWLCERAEITQMLKQDPGKTQ